MKHLLLTLVFVFSALSYASAVTNKIDTASVSNTDTVATSQLEDDSVASANKLNATNNKFTLDFDSGNSNDTVISVVAITMAFGIPAFVIIMILWFRYKNKKAKYSLAEKVLESGQTIPNDFFKEQDTFQSIKNKGIRNICLGIGLAVFLQILTDEEGLAAIGFLVFCVGVGQVIIAYTSRNNDENKDLKDGININPKENSNSVKDTDKE